jgi:CheY-like chemotaxis protein
MQQYKPPKWTSSERRISSSRRRPGRILLVDDYDDARATVRETLEQAGYVVIDTANGQQALNFLVSNFDEPVALIIVDLQMPVMDGWQFIDLLKCYVKLSTIPIIVVTGQPDPQLERITHRAVHGCLRAPYTLEALMAMVAQCLKLDGAQESGSPATVR